MVEVDDDDGFPINQEVPNYIELLAVLLGRDQQVETEDINQSKL